jgi:hypothetical protein
MYFVVMPRVNLFVILMTYVRYLCSINCLTVICLPQQISFRGDVFIFHLPRTLYFSLLSFNECSLFLELRLAFIFCLDFCSDIFISLHQGVFGPLVYVGIHQKRLF